MFPPGLGLHWDLLSLLQQALFVPWDWPIACQEKLGSSLHGPLACCAARPEPEEESARPALLDALLPCHSLQRDSGLLEELAVPRLRRRGAGEAASCEM